MSTDASGALRADVERLAAMTRDSAGEGERSSARWVARRLRETGVPEVRTEAYSYSPSYTWAYGLHAAAIGAGAALGGRAGRVLSLAALASLELDVSGRAQWLRRVLPQGAGRNVIGRLPAPGVRRATLVVVAHHDAARTGLLWHPALAHAGAARRARWRAMEPAGWPYALAAAAAASGTRLGRVVGGALSGLGVAAMADVHHSPTVPGANDNATGVAVLLALAERLAADPADGLEVIFVSPGGEEAGMGGMASFVARHGGRLDRASTFVLGLDTLGAGEPILAHAEGVLLAHRYDPADNDLVDAAAQAAGLEVPARWRIGAYTDPILARFAGLRTVSMLSVGPDGRYGAYHWPTDTPDRVDFRSVERCLALAEATARRLA